MTLKDKLVQTSNLWALKNAGGNEENARRRSSASAIECIEESVDMHLSWREDWQESLEIRDHEISVYAEAFATPTRAGIGIFSELFSH